MDLKIVIIIDIENIINPIDILLVTCNFDNNIHENKIIDDKKIEEVSKINEKMKSEGYNLDYLKIEYNINESEKKIAKYIILLSNVIKEIADIFDRLNVLNLEDSIFELKTIMDYFDRLYSDFDKERVAKKMFDDYIRSVLIKCKKLKKIVNNLSSKIDDIKYSYDLTDDDVHIISEIKSEILECETMYDNLVNKFREKNTAYSRLTKEMENINAKLLKAEDKLDYTLRSLGSLKEDEIRAHEQLDEIKVILKQTKTAFFPISSFFVSLHSHFYSTLIHNLPQDTPLSTQ